MLKYLKIKNIYNIIYLFLYKCINILNFIKQNIYNILNIKIYDTKKRVAKWSNNPIVNLSVQAPLLL